MREIIQGILEKVELENKETFSKFLYKCIKQSKEHTSVTQIFRINLFFAGLEKFANTLPKDKRFLFGVTTLEAILAELGFAIEPEEAFVLYQLRDLGKFKIKDSKLYEQLKAPWGLYKDYALTPQDFTLTIKALRRMALIEYRKGSLNLKENITITYKN